MKTGKGIGVNAEKQSGMFLIAAAIFLSLMHPSATFCQQRIAHVQPDALGPGMTIAMEVLAPDSDSGAFGEDGFYLPESKITFVNPDDSLLVVFGPAIVSWKGRVLQVPVLAKTSARLGVISFQIITGNKRSAASRFEIKQPQSISISGGAVLGDPSFALYSFNGNGNTIVADHVDFAGTDLPNRGIYHFSTSISDSTITGNPHYNPVTLLSRGPVRLTFAKVSVSADNLNGGPGGGGGGAGFSGTGGAGYTGGGSDSEFAPWNIGSGGSSTLLRGGASSTNVLGGASSFIAPNIDQGGGGGTGCPYGSSGIFSGGNDTSHQGGYGGGSAGGETPGVPFGGGGGAFATNGTSGGGTGNNGGIAYGGRYLVPMQGGSGGGAGNHISEKDSSAGNGGGGGGALTIVSFDTLSILNGFVTADGAKGSSGVNAVDAGGGGGSGGGITLDARSGIVVDNAIFTTNGGVGGSGGAGIEQTSKGGAGGTGRIRIDGEIRPKTPPNFFFSTTPISGPTVEIPQEQLNGPTSLIKGLAGDSLSLTDTIRVYYRNQHSSWRSIETPRFLLGDKMHWQTFLPLGHDSSLFVTTLATIANPGRAPAAYEPQLLLSHISSGILRVVPTPHLVFYQDTLIFGCFKAGDTCVSANFFITNQGEDSLHISSISISNPSFTVNPKKKDLGFYLLDSVKITYCPPKVGKDTAVISFISNDTLRTALLIGCGIDKDARITLKPSELLFGRRHIGLCDTLSVVAHSVGKDSALLIVGAATHDPFRIIFPTKDTLLPPKDSIVVRISFCPETMGNFHSSFLLTDKRDSVVVRGIGTKKILVAQEFIQGKRLCMHTCDTLRLKLASLGNDPVTVTGISGAGFVSVAPPFTIPPQTDTEFTLQYCAVLPGDTTIIIHLTSDADSSNQTTLKYYGISPAIGVDSIADFGSLCPQSTLSQAFRIRKIGVDSITIGAVTLSHGTSFSLTVDTSSRIDSLHGKVAFTPILPGEYTDTLIAVIHEGTCGDSILRIPLHGVAVNGDLVFSSSMILFGSVDTTGCLIDSLRVTNPCQNSATLTILQPPPPFAIISPPIGTLSFAGAETKTIVYSYCPRKVANDSATQDFHLESGNSFLVSLRGSGIPIIDSPFVRFALERTAATAGTQFSYVISVDSVAPGTAITSLHGSLRYDPLLVHPLSMSGVSWTVSGNKETEPGRYVFSASGTSALTVGPFGTIEMLGLYGASQGTAVWLDTMNLNPSARVNSDSGKITIEHCGNISENVIVAGAYLLGNPTPNPSNGNISFPVILGNDGVLRIRVFSESGSIALERSVIAKRGENTIVLDVEHLSSGIYYVSADSWGWRDGRTIVITK